MIENVLDLPIDARPDPDEFVRAAMEWHFNPQTGSAYWLRRAETLPFDPRADVTSVEDLALFPNIVDELRDVRVEDLIPRGYGPDPGIVGVYESGGTTGAPKRVVVLRDWWNQHGACTNAGLDAHGFPGNVDWLAVVPSGPHQIGEVATQAAAGRGGIKFSVDMDPRWVKKLIAAGKAEEADAYAEHLVEQAAFLLRTQDIGVVMTTPPLLERIARHDDLAGLINEKVQGIVWGGTHMDADTRYLYRTEVFPGVKLCARTCCCPATSNATWPPGWSRRLARPVTRWPTCPPSRVSAARMSLRGCTDDRADLHRRTGAARCLPG
ncbi:MAG TPA: hypothetical protein VFO16_17950, partial [Pseudonocardiaceae bacterium]|nr:hypothetical protein [Pseudonocardiaceae bacterium]